MGDSNSRVDVLGLHKNENISTGDCVLYAVFSPKMGKVAKVGKVAKAGIGNYEGAYYIISK